MIFLPSPRISFGYIVPCYQSSLAVTSASKFFERAISCWFMLFVLLISLSATCFAFASDLANILASNLSGVPENARGVMGCS